MLTTAEKFALLIVRPQKLRWDYEKLGDNTNPLASGVSKSKKEILGTKRVFLGIGKAACQSSLVFPWLLVDDQKDSFFMKITEKQAYRIRYLVLPDYVFQNDKLSYLAAKVYAFIHGYRAPEFFFSNEKLAELFNCHPISISKAISQLVSEKYIETFQPEGRKRYIVDLWVSQDANPGLAETLTHPQAEGLAETLTPNVPNSGSNRRGNDEVSNPNKNSFNKNTLAKNFEDEKDSEEFEAWRAAKRQKKQNKGRGVFQGRGFPPNTGSTPRYEKKERTGVHAEDVV